MIWNFFDDLLTNKKKSNFLKIMMILTGLISMEKVIKVFSSFEEKDKTEIEFSQNVSHKLKLGTLEVVRYAYYRIIDPDIEGI